MPMQYQDASQAAFLIVQERSTTCAAMTHPGGLMAGLSSVWYLQPTSLT